MAVNNGGGLTKVEVETIAVGPWEPISLGPKLEAVGGGFAPEARLENNGKDVRIRGQFRVKAGEELAIGEELGKLPAGMTPNRTINLVPVQGKGTTMTISVGGGLKCAAAIPSAEVCDLGSQISFVIK